MIRRDGHERDVQSNQQPSRHTQSDMNPVRRVTRCRSLDIAEAQVERNVGGLAPFQSQNQKTSLSVKSDTACISPAKSSKYSIKSQIENPGKSPTSVLEVESTDSALRDSAATESIASLRSKQSWKNQHKINLRGLEEHEEQDIDLEDSYLLDLGSLPSSFRISSSNFSARSDITGPTVFENQEETSVRTPLTRSRRSLVVSPDAAPLRPQRQTSQSNLSSSMSYGGNLSLEAGRQVDHRPSKPSRQSSRRVISGKSRIRANSIATSRSTDSSPCKPIRQKSVATLLGHTGSERAKLQCPSIDSSPPPKPQRKQSVRSLASSSSDDATHLQHQSIPFHESILEEASSSEHFD